VRCVRNIYVPWMMPGLGLKKKHMSAGSGCKIGVYEYVHITQDRLLQGEDRKRQ
jgi:hypothetical protein